MHRYLIICAMLLASCGPKLPDGSVPPELLAAPTGYVGPTPLTEGQIVDAALADQVALGQCVAQLGAIAALQSPDGHILSH